jgi:hypothetical protein
MKITPINSRIINQITFGEGNMNNITPKIGILSLHNSDKLNFERQLRLTQSADAVQSNPVKALGKKFKKAYNILFAENQTPSYRNISYIA